MPSTARLVKKRASAKPFPRAARAAFALTVLVLAAGCAGLKDSTVGKTFRGELPPFQPPPSAVRVAIDLYYQGLDMELEERYAEAEAFYRESLAASPRPVVHYRLGRVLQQQGKRTEARASYEDALALSEAYEDAREAIRQVDAAGQLEQLTGQAPVPPGPGAPLPDRRMADTGTRQLTPERVPAVEVIDVPTDLEAPATAPEDEPLPALPEPEPSASVAEDATLASVAARLREGSLDEAGRALDALLAQHPQDARVHYYAGNLATAREDLAGAQVAYERALELDPNLARAHNNLGLVHEASGRSRLALEHYQRAVDLEELPDAVYNLAVLSEKRGETENALAGFRRYIELDPAGPWSERAKLHIQRLEREF